jgi:transcription antitermination factor NusG
VSLFASEMATLKAPGVEGIVVNYPWYALHVRARHEKAVDRVLRERGYDALLPMYRARRRWSDRIQEVELPLFPCYVFCRFDPHRLTPIMTTPGVIRPISFGTKIVPVDEAEIGAIQAVIGSRLNCEPWPYFRVGQRVRIEHGCLSGLEGFVQLMKGRFRLVVSVTLLQRSCAVEIDQAWLSPIPPDSPRMIHDPAQHSGSIARLDPR